MNLSTVVDAIQGMPAFSILFKITILLVLGWTVQAFLRRGHPEWRILLWRVLAAGYLTVPVLDLFQPFAFYEMKVTAPQTAIVEMPLESAPSRPDIAAPPVPRPDSFNPVSTPVETVAQSVDGRPIADNSISWPWWVWITVLWAVGMTLCFVRLGRAWHRLYALDKTSLPASEELQSILSEVARDLSCGKTVQLRANSQINTPFLLGVLRPKIYLPSLYTQPEYREDLPGILAHELTHLQNRDLAWKLVFECFFCLFWFHPLTWKIASTHDFACEEICDRAASQYVGDLQQYTKTLARAALDSRTLLPGCAVLPFARPSNIHRRLSRLQTAIAAPLSKKALVLCSLPLLMVIGGINGIVWTEGGEDAVISTTQTTLDNPPQTQNTKMNNQPVTSSLPVNEDANKLHAITVAGQVMDEAGNPLSPAEVKVYVLTKNRKEIITTTQVNDDGTFSLSLPKPGDYILVSTPPLNYAEKTTLATIENNSRFDFKHAFAPLHVQGMVIEQGTNQPIAGARVYLIPVHDPTNKGIHPNQSGIEGITDTNGVFNIPRVATGYFAFGADAKGHISLSPIDGDQTPNPYLRVMINEQTQSHSFPIHLAKGDAARIRVVDSNGNPVPQAEVNVYGEKDYFGRYEQFTDENGECLFDTLAPGMAAALAKKESVGETISASFQTGSQESPTTITITIPKPARIYGIVRDANRQPVAKRDVHILYSELGKRTLLLGRKNSSALMQTDDKGRYQFEGLGEGEYTLTVQLENGKFGDKNRLRNRFSGWIRKVVQTKAGESIQADFDPIEEEKSQPSDAITIRGKVIDTDQQPIAEATVSFAVQKRENRLRSYFQNPPAKTNSEGEFEFTNVYKGDTLTFYVNWKSNSRTFEGIPSQTEPITLVIEPAGIVHGNVVDSKTGVQIAGAHAVLSAMGQHPPQTADSMVTGDFYIRDVSPQQNCSLEITAPGYLPINLSNISVKNGEITHLKFEMIEG